RSVRRQGDSFHILVVCGCSRGPLDKTPWKSLNLKKVGEEALDSSNTTASWPVRISLDRDVDMQITGHRHAFLAKYKAGATK
ncbi:unnamed protein product, partial [Ectocarpus sp. 13 AM-2016]